VRRFVAVAAALLALAGLLAWVLAGRQPAPPVVVARVGYWQQATLPAGPAAAVTAALRDLGPRARPPAADATRYTLRAGARTVVYAPAQGLAYADGAWHRLPPLPAAAFAQAAAAAEDSFHGELVTWDVAQHLFPLRSDALVVDYRTGLSFWVRRLAGSRHADVQPLTAADTAVMKRIYGGSWSWARRPVLVEVSGHRLAASMNGMPHGAGSIQGNGFPGHFCIHFLLSEVHKTRAIDPGHLWAILTAAGVRLPPPAIPADAPTQGC
jgi:hypothetical protein